MRAITSSQTYILSYYLKSNVYIFFMGYATDDDDEDDLVTSIITINSMLVYT